MMKQSSLRLADTPLVSQVESTEIIRRMPIPRRVIYLIVTLGGAGLGLALAIVASVLVALLLLTVLFDYSFFAGDTLMVDNLIMFSVFPVALSYMLALGLSAQSHGEAIKPGESLTQRARAALRYGLVSGLIVSGIFGFLWYLAVSIGVIYIDLNTIFDTQIRLSDFFIYSTVLALSVAPLLALYRGFVTVIGPVMLHRLRYG